MNANSAAARYASAIHTPASTSQMTLRISRTPLPQRRDQRWRVQRFAGLDLGCVDRHRRQIATMNHERAGDAVMQPAPLVVDENHQEAKPEGEDAKRHA